jgi:hypothetical protein
MPGRRRSHDEELHREAEQIAVPENDVVAGQVPGVGPAIDGTDDVGRRQRPGASGGEEETIPPAASPNAVPG